MHLFIGHIYLFWVCLFVLSAYALWHPLVNITHGHLLTCAAQPQQPSHSLVLSPAPCTVHFVPTSQHLCRKFDCYEMELSMSLPRIVHCQLLTICHIAPNSAHSAHPPPSHSHASSNSISGGLSPPPTPSTVTLLCQCWAVCGSIGESPDWHCCSNITPTWLQLVSHAFHFSLFWALSLSDVFKLVWM